MAAATNPALGGGSSGSNNGGGGSGFEWPTWATAVIAGVGGALVIAILAGCCIWRKKANKRKRTRHAMNTIGNGGAKVRPGQASKGERKRGASPLQEKQFQNGSGSSLTVVGSRTSTPTGKPKQGGHGRDGQKRLSRKGAEAGAGGGGLAAAAAGYHDVPQRRSEDRERRRSRGRPQNGPQHAYDYPPYPAPPMRAAPGAGVDLHAPSPPHHQHQRGHSPYRAVGMNDSAQTLPAGYAPYPTDEYGNPLGPPISPFRATHQRYGSGATDDSGYDTPGNRTFDGSAQGSPARLLPNAAPMPGSRSSPGLSPVGAGGAYQHYNDSREHQPIIAHGHGPRQLYTDQHVPPPPPESSQGHGAGIGNAMMASDDEDDEDDAPQRPPIGVAHGSGSSGEAEGGGRQAVEYPVGDVRNRRTAPHHRLPADVDRSGVTPSPTRSAPPSRQSEYHDMIAQPQGYYDTSDNVPSSPHMQ